jgi:hypothetical protein
MVLSRTIEAMLPVSPNSPALLCWKEVPNYKHTTQGEVDNADRFQQMACNEYFVVRRNVTKPVRFT